MQRRRWLLKRVCGRIESLVLQFLVLVHIRTQALVVQRQQFDLVPHLSLVGHLTLPRLVALVQVVCLGALLS